MLSKDSKNLELSLYRKYCPDLKALMQQTVVKVTAWAWNLFHILFAICTTILNRIQSCNLLLRVQQSGKPSYGMTSQNLTFFLETMDTASSALKRSETPACYQQCYSRVDMTLSKFAKSLCNFLLDFYFWFQHLICCFCISFPHIRGLYHLPSNYVLTNQHL